jgi:hypothetical protein
MIESEPEPHVGEHEGDWRVMITVHRTAGELVVDSVSVIPEQPGASEDIVGEIEHAIKEQLPG